MSSRPRTFVLLIGAARAIPFPVPSNATQVTSEPNPQIQATDSNTAGYIRRVALQPSSTAELSVLVIPITPSLGPDPADLVTTPIPYSSEADPADMVTPVDPSSFSANSYELTEITPVPGSTSSPGTVTTISFVPPTSTTETRILPLPTSSLAVIPVTGHHGDTVTITHWVTITLPGLPPNDSGSVTAPITVGPVQESSPAGGRPDMPGGILGGPAPNACELDETQSKE